MIEAGKEKLIVANWKAYLTIDKAHNWLQEFSNQSRPWPGLKVILGVPAPFLFHLQDRYPDLPGTFWAVQDVSPFPLGSYTGSSPAAWFAGSAGYAIVGHRERRKYFHETNQEIANKIAEALEENIKPILCVDLESAGQQAAAVGQDELEKLVVAYTPADAEKLEVSRNKDGVQDGIDRISAVFQGAPVLYGGGVNEKNVAELMRIKNLAGVMVAGGCIDPQAFIRLLHNAERHDAN